jgi:DNA recombination protein RmuC
MRVHLLFHLVALAAALGGGLAAGAWLAMHYFKSRHQMETARREAEWTAQLAVAREQAGRLPELTAECERLRAGAQEKAMRLAALEAQSAEERKGAAERLALLEDARKQLEDSFHAISAEALRKNNQSFLELAKETLGTFQESAKGDLEKRQQAISEIVTPVRESLAKVDVQINELEKHRAGAYESLHAQVKSLLETQHQLRAETGNLVKALRAPNVRGRWGEVQLRRVVEMAGMVDHCDFKEQQSVTGEEGGALRPDMIVQLPEEKTIVVDAKAPISAYLDALEAPDDAARAERLARHAAQVRAHIEALSRKAYWEQFNPTPEFVVLFLPGEMFFSAALERDPTLIEYGAEKRVILATPTTLIALLKAIFFGWRQQKLAKNAEEISRLGRSLYKGLSTMGGHIEKLGKSLGKSVQSYNQAVASLESRVMVRARQFKELEVDTGGLEIETLEQAEQLPRQLQAPELTEGAEVELVRTLEAGDARDLEEENSGMDTE